MQISTVCILILGIALRGFYFSITPSEVRGHDFDGHMAYVSYVLDHWNIPATHENWQAYQPPLYYFVSAAWLSIIGWGDTQEGWGYILQWGSLAFSVITLFLGVWICHQLFKKKNDIMGFCLSSLCIAVFPSLIFFAPRINNDALVQVFAFLSIGFLLSWLQKRTISTLIFLAISLAFGLLTKNTIAPLIITSIGCIALAQRKNLRHLLRNEAIFVLVISIIWAWLPFYKFFEANDYKQLVVGNYQTLTNFVENNVKNVTTFNPIAVLQFPYNDPYNDIARRQIFWEYFYKSALTGEFNFGAKELPFVLLMIIFSFMLLPFIFIEAWNDAKNLRIETSPLWLGIPIILFSHWCFRLTFPYSSSQDFRYSIFIIVPLVYFACRTCAKHANFEPIKQFAAIGFITTACIFLLRINA